MIFQNSTIKTQETPPSPTRRERIDGEGFFNSRRLVLLTHLLPSPTKCQAFYLMLINTVYTAREGLIMENIPVSTFWLKVYIEAHNNLFNLDIKI